MHSYLSTDFLSVYSNSPSLSDELGDDIEEESERAGELVFIAVAIFINLLDVNRMTTAQLYAESQAVFDLFFLFLFLSTYYN